jgi:hypothetical protein
MRKFSMALACLGFVAFAAPLQAAPISASGSLGSGATRSAMNEAVSDNAATQVRYGRGHRAVRHYGWNRGHHYGWRPRTYGYRPYYAPRAYGFVPRPYRYW